MKKNPAPLPGPIMTVLCGHCYEGADHDGDVYLCRSCGLTFDESLDEPGQYIDDTKAECGEPIPESNIFPMKRVVGNKAYATEYHTYYVPCNLPTGHESEHYFALVTDTRVVDPSTLS